MSLPKALPFLVLFVCLSLPAVLPEIGNIAFFVLSALGLALLLARPDTRIVLRQPAVYVPAIALFGLALTFWAATGSLEAALGVYVFAPLVLIGPMAAVLRASAGPLPVSRIGLFASIGAVAAAGVAIYDSFALGSPQPGSSVNNSIHFAGIALTLAFASLIALYDHRYRAKVMALVGFAAGVLALWLSTSRGPLVALPGMMAVGAAVVTLQRLPPALRFPIFVGGAIVGLTTIVVLSYSGVLDSLPGFGEIISLVRDGSVTDRSTRERLDMYLAAWRAWQASPFVGHGLSDFVQTAASYMPEIAEFPVYEHLHSDSADFAVVGGTAGIVLYLSILSAPLLSALRSPQSQVRSATPFLSATVVTGYALMGLTNAMFGLLTQTVLFSSVCAITAFLSAPTRQSQDKPL